MNLKIFAGIFLLCHISSVLSSNSLKVDPECVKPWHIVGDMCILLQSKFRTWDRAEFYCKIFHGDLLYIENEQEQLALEDYLDTLLKERPVTEEFFWIGSTNRNDNQTWSWTANQEPVTYDNWHATLHNRYISQHDNAHCVGVMFSDMKWRDANCEETAQFICRRNYVRSNEVSSPQTVNALVHVSDDEVNAILGSIFTHKPPVKQLPLAKSVVQGAVSYEEVLFSDKDEAKAIFMTLFSPQPVLMAMPGVQPVVQIPNPKSTTQKMQFLDHNAKVLDHLNDEHLLSNYDDSDVITTGKGVIEKTAADEDQHILNVAQNIPSPDVMTSLQNFNPKFPVQHTIQETWKVPSHNPDKPDIVIQSKTITDENSVEEVIENLPKDAGLNVAVVADHKPSNTEQSHVEPEAVVADNEQQHIFSDDEISKGGVSDDDATQHFGDSAGHPGHDHSSELHKPLHDNSQQPILNLEPNRQNDIPTATPAPFNIPPRFNFKPNANSQSLTDASSRLSYSLSIFFAIFANMIVQRLIQ